MADAEVIDAWIDRPFLRFGDSTTEVIYLRCRVAVGEYTALTMGTSTLTSAATAGVTGLDTDFLNSNARWCGDENFSFSNRLRQEFIRKFAVVPAAHTDYASGVYTTPPTYGTKTINELYDTFSGAVTRRRIVEFVQEDAQSNPVAARLEYSYTTDPANATLLTKEGYQITKSTPTVSDVGGVVTYNDAVSTVVATGTTDVLQDTSVELWHGDIYEVLTIYKLS